MLAPLPRLLCSVCLFGFTPTYKPMISQSHHHHHHHYQLTRDHYNPHSGFDAVSAPQSTAKEPDHSLYISLSLNCHRTASSGLTIYIAPAIHTLTLLSSDFLPYSTVDASSAPMPLSSASWSLRDHPCSYSNIHGRGGTGATSGDVDVPEGDDPL